MFDMVKSKSGEVMIAYRTLDCVLAEDRREEMNIITSCLCPKTRSPGRRLEVCGG